jgi:hypothetical protein
MEKTKQEILQQLKKDYEAACNGYLAELLRMWELDAYYGYWSSDEPGTIYHYGETHNLTMDDIIYIVEHDIEEDEVLEWEDYCLDAYEFKFETPNLRAWHMGCPRTPQETFERLRQLKADLNQSVEDEKARMEKDARMKKADEEKEALLNQKLADQYLTVRTLLCLKNLGCETVRDLVELSPSKRRELGKRATAELIDFMDDMGLAWQNINHY